MDNPTAFIQSALMSIHHHVRDILLDMAGEVAYLWVELSCAAFAVAAFCWVVSRC